MIWQRRSFSGMRNPDHKKEVVYLWEFRGGDRTSRGVTDDFSIMSIDAMPKAKLLPCCIRAFGLGVIRWVCLASLNGNQFPSTSQSI